MNQKNIKKAVCTLLRHLKDSGYTKNTIAFYRSRCNAIMAKAELEGAELNLADFLRWADQFSEGKSNSIRCCMARVLVMLDCIIRDVPLPRGNVSTVVPLKAKNPEFAETVRTFEELLQKRGQEKNTVKFSVYCATHFFSYLENLGIGSIAEAAGKHVVDYQRFDGQGYASSTKRAMAYRLKQLFEHLHAENLTVGNLALCMSTDYAIRRKTVAVLPEDAQKAMLECGNGFSSAKQARDYAVCMLAFRLMLRASDIVRLKLGDIDWVGRKISIVQKKTKKALALPLTDDVGNALAEYILDFRPNSDHDEIFLQAAFPGGPVANLNDCLGSVLRRCGYAEPNERLGLHMLRRTGASNLLKAGVPVDMISTMLGHQNASTVDPYLSTDEKRMLLCCGNFRIPCFMEGSRNEA
jgi:integrase